MGKYINADTIHWHDDGWACIRKDEYPTIDIVRCSECKYNSICNHNVQHTTRDWSSVTIGYKSVDYCSYGERKGE